MRGHVDWRVRKKRRKFYDIAPKYLEPRNFLRQSLKWLRQLLSKICIFDCLWPFGCHCDLQLSWNKHLPKHGAISSHESIIHLICVTFFRLLVQSCILLLQSVSQCVDESTKQDDTYFDVANLKNVLMVFVFTSYNVKMLDLLNLCWVFAHYLVVSKKDESEQHIWLTGFVAWRNHQV